MHVLKDFGYRVLLLLLHEKRKFEAALSSTRNCKKISELNDLIKDIDSYEGIFLLQCTSFRYNIKCAGIRRTLL